MTTNMELSEGNPALLQHVLSDPPTEYGESSVHKPYVLNENVLSDEHVGNENKQEEIDNEAGEKEATTVDKGQIAECEIRKAMESENSSFEALFEKEEAIVYEGQVADCDNLKAMESGNFNFEKKQQLEVCGKNESHYLEIFGGESGKKNGTVVCTESLVDEVSPSTEPGGADASKDQDTRNESSEDSHCLTGENAPSDEHEEIENKQEGINNEAPDDDGVLQSEEMYEKSQPNNDLIQEALNHQLARYWTATSHRPHVLNPVAIDTDEYKEVSIIFKWKSTSLRIRQLERIENPYLLALYLNKKEELLEKNSFVEEKNLFHGTSDEYVDNICKNNFDWRRRGMSKGCKFGQGVCFAPCPWYAHYFGRSNVMILSKVLVGKGELGNSGTVVPSEPHDTTHNGKDTVYVKYEDDDFYPQYVIHFDCY